MGNGLCVSLRDPFRGSIVFRVEGLNGLWGLLLRIISGLIWGSIPPFPTKHQGDNQPLNGGNSRKGELKPWDIPKESFDEIHRDADRCSLP